MSSEIKILPLIPSAFFDSLSLFFVFIEEKVFEINYFTLM